MADKRDLASVVLGGRELVTRTELEDFKYIRHNWSSVYTIIRPGRFDDVWRAVAKWGNHDELVSWTADGLLRLIRRHYGPKTEGYPFKIREIGR